jgi:hypothetical protein
MFEKVPYGVKVRVRGNEKDGFIAEYYGYNRRAAKAALDILSSEHIKIIKKKIQKGET